MDYLIADDDCSALSMERYDQQAVGYYRLAAGADFKARQRREGKVMLNPDLDPVGVSDTPNIVHDPQRQAAISQEFQRKLEYLWLNYNFCRKVLGPRQAFNQSIQDLRDALHGKVELSDIIDDLQLEIRIVFGHFLEEMTGRSSLQWRRCSDEELRKVAKKVTTKIFKREGPSRDDILPLHVAGIMAAVQECCGRRVTMVKEIRDIYGPVLSKNQASQTVRDIMKAIDPDIAERTIALAVHKLRKEYAGKPMRFCDLFPFYGGGLAADGMTPKPGHGHKLVEFTPICVR
ncbi:hypothetical protein [Parasphingopyxis lamellibrachiae]|uniref:Uncharacterized protein n=1 Tax=Parasphingopyxis lamellibrachiae TaxID=680125 RepID=A0A3D9F651_9SPHN|nr:hypothetical protein [Parasphingopyxis lamellibrachiae]RED11018.1 hypothetical protein DFR46_2955 [Parasphingopyxis lamellibrachiae]